jgi:hypothetical protein
MTKPPKAKIRKMHTLLDEALGIWQSDVREWAEATQDTWMVPSDVTEELIFIAEVLRRMRVEVEQPP